MESPYTAIDHYWPVQFQLDSTKSGGAAKVLLKDEWYDVFKPVYDYWKEIAAFDGCFSVDALPSLTLPKFPVEIGAFGITIFVFRLVVWAARTSIQLSKYEIFHEPSMGGCKIGWTPSGPVLYREV